VLHLISGDPYRLQQRGVALIGSAAMWSDLQHIGVARKWSGWSRM